MRIAMPDVGSARRARLWERGAGAVIEGGTAALARTGDPLGLLVHDALGDPYGTYEKIRQRGPAPRSRLGPRLVVGHSLARTVLRDPRFGRDPSRSRNWLGPSRRWTERRATDDPLLPTVQESMILCDPPEHNRIRKIGSRAMAAATVDVLPRIESIVDELVGELPVDAPFDVVRRLALLAPARTIVLLLGLPAEATDYLVELGDELAFTTEVFMRPAERRRKDTAKRALLRFYDDVAFEALRSGHDGFVADLAAAADGEPGLTRSEIVATLLLLTFAGFETTANLITNGVQLLLDRPDLQAELVARPEAMPAAVDELLRVESPLQLTARFAADDVVVEDVAFTKGQAILVLLGAANRDPAVFEHPAELRLGRTNAREHVAFGGGIHVCLGANLAKLEGGIALQRLLELGPLGAAGAARRKHDLLVLRGFDELPVRVRR